METRRYSPVILLAVLLISAVTGPAFAQKPADSEEGTLALESMVVVGDKIGRDLQRLPTSTSVIDATRIASEPIADIDGILNRVPNVTADGDAQFGAFSIRGVNSNSLIAGFNQANVLATVFINQAPLGGYTSDYLRPSTWDLSSAEVLRGPQSTLQGPNSLIGAVFFNYARPNFSTEGRVRAEYGELDTWNIAAYQNIPLIDDKLAARISVETRNNDGDIENTLTGDDIATVEEQMIRAQLYFQPFGDEDVNFNLTGIFADSDSNALPRAVEVGDIELEDRLNTENFPGKYPAETIVTVLESEIRFNEKWTLIGVTGYSDFEVDQTFDGDLSSADLLRVDADVKEELFNQDLRLNYTGTRLRGLLGLYFGYADLSSFVDSGGIFLGGPFNTVLDLGEEVVTTAVYGNFDYDLFKQLTVNAGVRFNYENRDNSNTSTFNGLVADLGGEEDFTQVLPTISLTYSFTDDLRAGVKYSRGYRSGGIAVAPFAQLSQAFDEEFTNNYELFMRSELLDNRLTLNANLFYTDWRDQQLPVLPTGGFPGFDELTVNAGRTELSGFELELTMAATRGLDIFAAIGYTHSEFKDFVFNGKDFAGESLPNAPEWTVSLGVNYSHSSGFFANGSYRWVDEAYSEIGFPEETVMKTRNLLDGKIGYLANHWSAYVWGTNLLDDFYETYLAERSAFGVARYGSLSTPRRVGVGVEFYW